MIIIYIIIITISLRWALEKLIIMTEINTKTDISNNIDISIILTNDDLIITFIIKFEINVAVFIALNF